MPRTCVFCGGTPLTREHVLPRWLRAAFPDADGRAVHVRESLTNQHVREGSLLDATAKIVCGDCNSGWMNDLEAEVRDFLPRMIRGRPIMLGAKRQAALAIWCVKTVMMLQTTHPKEDQQAIPAEDYAALFRDRQPNAMTTVWAGYLRDVPHPHPNVDNPVEFIGEPLRCDVTIQNEHGTETISGHAFVATLRLGHFVTQAIRIGPAEFPINLTPVKLWPYLAVLWPADGVQRWPPRAIEEVGGFHVLAGALAADDAVTRGPYSV
jgi:hypothetical protein